MNNVNKTLYIPLYGKSYVSRKGLFLKDEMAEKIWAAEGFRLKGKSRSKWLAYYMGIRAAVFDDWTRSQMALCPDAAVIHLGCGLDSRCLRCGDGKHHWYDADFPDVIAERERYYARSAAYTMVSGDVREHDWLDALPEGGSAIVVMEGLSMYLTQRELLSLVGDLCARFDRIVCLMDCYTVMAARLSRYKNPINDVGVTLVYGLDDPKLPEQGGFSFVQEHPLTPVRYIDALHGAERAVFSKLYAGGFSKKLYRLYEYRKG